MSHPDDGPPAAESRDSAPAVQAASPLGTPTDRERGAPRPPLEDVTSPAFAEWARGKSVPDHLANAQQLLELMAASLCEHRTCPHCNAIRGYADGIRSRLAAIALRAMPPRTPRAIEVEP